jgi:Tol biopolymer transport system component
MINRMRFLLVLTLLIRFAPANAQIPAASSVTPSIYEDGLVNTSLNERDFAISPDGSEIYFTISTPKSSFQTIVFCKKEKSGKWSPPAIASFAGNFSDLEPAFGIDGNTLYFASNRPFEGNTIKDFDIWKVTRKNNVWGTPENLGVTVNTSADEFYPCITAKGNLYFTAAYAGGPGKEDIYVSSIKDNMWQKPTPMDTTVNSTYYEFNAFISRDEKFILFTSYGRKDDTGGGDLYISVRGADGKWTKAQNIKELNSSRLDYCPYVSPDGKSLFFTSDRHQLPSSFPEAKANYQQIVETYNNPLNGNGNIYWVAFKLLERYFSNEAR